MITYLVLGLALVFVSAVLAVLGAGDWAVDKLSQKKSIYETVVGKELRRLFLNTSIDQFVFIHLMTILGAIGLGYFFVGGIFWTLVSGIVGVILPRFYLKWRWKKRIEEVDSQVEEAMVYMSNSFKANPSLPEAIGDVTNSMPPPISEELEVVLREYQLGTPLDEALINLQNRMPARNLELAVSAIRIGRAVGGNIPEILEDIANTIRESYRLRQVIETQTAQGRLQAWVMGLMPAAVCGLFYLLDPELIRPLFETLGGYIILAIAIVLNIIGVYFILKVIDIRV
jgi:tight adherence protein B